MPLDAFHMTNASNMTNISNMTNVSTTTNLSYVTNASTNASNLTNASTMGNASGNMSNRTNITMDLLSLGLHGFVRLNMTNMTNMTPFVCPERFPSPSLEVYNHSQNESEPAPICIERPNVTNVTPPRERICDNFLGYSVETIEINMTRAPEREWADELGVVDDGKVWLKGRKKWGPGAHLVLFANNATGTKVESLHVDIYDYAPPAIKASDIAWCD
jgi:hypothetical protein